MLALVYNDPLNNLSVSEIPIPSIKDHEVLIKVIRAGICSTDIHICNGYVPGFASVLGHEFVGSVVECAVQPDLTGKRVVGEINCNVAKFTCQDAVFQRNHAPGRTVLGIINKDGCLAEYTTLPVGNLHLVPDAISDQEACYAEPLAAACRIIEQGLLQNHKRIAVIGDGKLGLLVAAALAVSMHGRDHPDPDLRSSITLIGRHEDKMALVEGIDSRLLVTDELGDEHAAKFDLVVEATGSPSGIRLALKLLRPMGTLVLKSTVSLNDPSIPLWSELANDIVVNEKTLVGSRCGPMDMALSLMAKHESIRNLLNHMTSRVFHISEGIQALEFARQKGILKVQVSFT